MAATLPNSAQPEPRDDRIYPVTRWSAAVIVPFLVLAFLILFLYPDESGRRFAWTVWPRMTAMYIGAGYLGGAYLFVHAIFGRRWHRVAAGFPAVTAFTVSMLLITIIHWPLFDLGHFPFQLWLVLYVVTPILVPVLYLLNRRTDPGTLEAVDATVPNAARFALGAFGAGLLVFSLVTFIWPGLLIPMWPWALITVTGRAMAGWFLILGVGGVVIARDTRWSAWRVGMESIALWHVLVLLAAALNPGEFTGGYPFNWYLVGVAVVLILLVVLYALMYRRIRAGTPQP